MLSLVASGDELVQLTDKIFKRRERQLNSQQYLLTIYVLTKFWPHQLDVIFKFLIGSLDHEITQPFLSCYVTEV